MKHKHITMAGLDPATQCERSASEESLRAQTRACWVAALNAAMVKEV
jgi:hypothetical protein